MFLCLFQCDADGLRTPVAPDGQLNGAASRSFVDHPAELYSAFDTLAVEGGDNVVFLQGGLCCRAVRRDVAEYDALFGRKPQFFYRIRVDVACFGAEPACAVIRRHQGHDFLVSERREIINVFLDLLRGALRRQRGESLRRLVELEVTVREIRFEPLLQLGQPLLQTRQRWFVLGLR